MTNQTNNKTMHVALWIAQVLLGGMMLMAGLGKALQPVDALAEAIPWTTDVPIALTRFIGVSELLGALGLILPSLLRIKPILTVLAALGLVTIMVLAAIFHATRGEFAAIGFNVPLMAVAAFIAWGRIKKAPIQAKG